MMNSEQPSQFAYEPHLYTEYIVKADDTLSQIAYKLLGDARWSDVIHAMNREVIGDNRHNIFPDQLLRIPVPLVADAAARISRFHIVRDDGPNTLSQLAEYYYSVDYTDADEYEARLAADILKIAAANGATGLDQAYNDRPINTGSRLLIPDVRAINNDETLKPLYRFNSVNVWARRWVNLLRSIKTAQGMSEWLVGPIDAVDVSDDLDRPIDVNSGPLVVPINEPVSAPSEPEVIAGGDEDDIFANVEYMSAEESKNTVDETVTHLDDRDIRLVETTADDPSSSAEYGTQMQVIQRLLVNLGRFTDQTIGPIIASLTPPIWQPTHHVKTPPTGLLRLLLDQASTDLENLEKAMYQRQYMSQADGGVAMSRQGETLFDADRLAASALQPILPLISNRPDNVVTYYNESMHIRQIPYDKSTILIGLPFASVSSYEDDLKGYHELIQSNSGIADLYEARIPYDYMAIPHELGHFLFHNGVYSDRPIRPFLSEGVGSKGRFRGWLEEIFADTVGIFTAGPLAVLGMQSVLAGTFKEELFEDDGYHPLSVIRPFVMSHILRKLAATRLYPEMDTVADLLDQNWEATLRLRGVIPALQPLFRVELNFNAHENHADPLAAHHFSNRRARMALRHGRVSKRGRTKLETTSLPEALMAVDDMIDECVAVVTGHLDSEHAPWSGNVSRLAELDDRLEAFTQQAFEYAPIPQPMIAYVPGEQRQIEMNPAEARRQAMSILSDWGDGGTKGGHGGAG